ncbi:unnamed protein product [Protopolystoma xenopodis]|uniref:Uncharacterized protein n=1 Tax=Protopolystoma xenopodis TaxID=117903 RepID=A0A448XEP4_9PLAT|nr:unnamed protein product [Protopolystoma xenopodis]
MCASNLIQTGVFKGLQTGFRSCRFEGFVKDSGEKVDSKLILEFATGFKYRDISEEQLKAQLLSSTQIYSANTGYRFRPESDFRVTRDSWVTFMDYVLRFHGSSPAGGAEEASSGEVDTEVYSSRDKYTFLEVGLPLIFNGGARSTGHTTLQIAASVLISLLVHLKGGVKLL